MLKVRKSEIKERVARCEWDFTTVPAGEERGCCYFEYARESKYIMASLDNPVPWHKATERSRALGNNLLTYGLPGKWAGRTYFDSAWLAKDSKWRREVCQRMEAHANGLSYARILKSTPDRAFHVGMSPHFCWSEWTEQHQRLADKETGLEVLLVTIDWMNFEDREIVEQFKRWLKSKDGRPARLGLRSRKGKKSDVWRKGLERLAALRLLHNYSWDEICEIVPAAWGDRHKFSDRGEFNRERNASRAMMLDLFPFLPKATKPLSWKPLSPRL